MTVTKDRFPSIPPCCTLCPANAYHVRRRGLMLVLSSPSGAGKSTICQTLLGSKPDLTLSVSVTTRAPRPGEINGRDYHFTTVTEFKHLLATSGLLEQAIVFGNYYGIPRQPVEEALKAGHDILFAIDWQGYRKLKADSVTDVVGVFILPPSVEELEYRLHRRNQDSSEIIASRMAEAADTISHWNEYSYVIINRDVQHSVATIEAILETERLKRYRRAYIPSIVELLKNVSPRI